VFTKNRERFLEIEIVTKFFAAILERARQAGLLSDEHFAVDGTLVSRGPTTRVSSPMMSGHRRRSVDTSRTPRPPAEQCRRYRRVRSQTSRSRAEAQITAGDARGLPAPRAIPRREQLSWRLYCGRSRWPEESSAVPEPIGKQKVRLLVAQTDCLRLGMRRNYAETKGIGAPACIKASQRKT
jgi:hypothetical protein